MNPILDTSHVHPIRGPRRPNPLGLHLVDILAVHADRIEFAGVDTIDNTYLIDLKPHVDALDTPARTNIQPRSGWFDSVDREHPHNPNSLHSRVEPPETDDQTPRLRRCPRWPSSATAP